MCEQRFVNMLILYQNMKGTTGWVDLAELECKLTEANLISGVPNQGVCLYVYMYALLLVYIITSMQCYILVIL